MLQPTRLCIVRCSWVVTYTSPPRGSRAGRSNNESLATSLMEIGKTASRRWAGEVGYCDSRGRVSLHVHVRICMNLLLRVDGGLRSRPSPQGYKNAHI